MKYDRSDVLDYFKIEDDFRSFDIDLNEYLDDVKYPKVYHNQVDALEAATRDALSAHELPVDNINVTPLEDRHGSIAGLRLGLRKAHGWGEETHRAIRSMTFPAQKLRGKYLELAGLDMDNREKYKKKKKRRKEKKRHRDEVATAMREKTAEILPDVDIAHNRMHAHGLGPDQDNRLTAYAQAGGINVDLKSLTPRQYSAVLVLLTRPGTVGVGAERAKQIARGYNENHDAKHDGRELLRAALMVAAFHTDVPNEAMNGLVRDNPDWMWRLVSGHASHDRYEEALETAAALIVAELDRVKTR